jgi:hypothetical protein
MSRHITSSHAVSSYLILRFQLAYAELRTCLVFGHFETPETHRDVVTFDVNGFAGLYRNLDRILATERSVSDQGVTTWSYRKFAI